MKVTALGIDLAKNVFQIHGIDQHGMVMLKKQLKRERAKVGANQTGQVCAKIQSATHKFGGQQ